MKTIVFSPEAERDVRDIWQYIAEDNETAADGYSERLLRVIEQLKEAPRLGRPRPELHPNLRSIAVENHVILYDFQPERILIVRVLHGKQDVGRAFRGTR